MIKHLQIKGRHEVTPLTERAALFLNTFVGRTIIMTDKEFGSMELEMSAHGCWFMKSDPAACYHTQRAHQMARSSEDM